MADLVVLKKDVQDTEVWQDKPWRKFQKVVFRLQKRIYQAQQRGDHRTVRKLQRLLLNSRAARLLAVRRVTQENKGKHTAGVDGVASLRAPQRVILAENLSHSKGKTDPIRRLYIPKPGKKERRPLGIPTMIDRARQTLVKFALEPEWEAKFEANSYGFRPGRSAHDAIGAIFLSIKHTPKYVLDTDIEKCFDRIDHNYLLDKLNTFPLLRRLIKSWLKAGIMEGDVFTIPKAGTPQGGPLSPLLANVALHGLEETLHRYIPKRKNGVDWRPTIIRYADDLVILHRDLETLHELREKVENFLAPIGLQLKSSKTRMTHTLNACEGKPGFDFLGFKIRQYKVGKYRSGKNGAGNRLGFKTLIRPSKEAQRQHLRTTGTLLRRYRGRSQEELIEALTPRVIGWCNYNAHVVSKKVFALMSRRLHHQLAKWTKWRHPSKGHRWRMNRYWKQTPKGTSFGKYRRLVKHTEMSITRHVKVTGSRSPYDGDWAYWGRRLPNYIGLSPMKRRLLKEQNGKCGYCGLFFHMNDRIEVHHQDGNSKNNRFSNLTMLHQCCHHFVHGTYDKGHQIDKPDDFNGSRPVLQRQEAG